MTDKELTHASFFSGVGGLDIGFERAGWRTVSLSEIDPYASAVLAERFPGVVNIGNIVGVRDVEVANRVQVAGVAPLERAAGRHDGASDKQPDDGRDDWRTAFLWSGGFPCQDLSVAGKRAGFGGERSVLAFAFLDLVERYRPPAILLENVPGLLSSHAGRDFGALIDRMAELGYGVAYRVLDARHFGVPQRRRRVFILGLRSDPDDADGHLAAERAAAVLAVGTRCERHSAAGGEARAGTPGGASHGVAADGADSTRTIQAGFGHHGWTLGAQDVDGGLLQLVGASVDADRVRAASRVAGRLDDRAFVDTAPVVNSNKSGGWRFDADQAESLVRATEASDDDPLLPLGLDSHRYRVCGNGVVSHVAQWIGERLICELQGHEL